MERLIGLIIALPFGAALWAVLLRFFTKTVTKVSLPYAHAFMIMLLVLVISSTATFITGSIIYNATGDQNFPRVDALIIPFFVGAFIYGTMIKHPEMGPVGLSKGFLISLRMILIPVGFVIAFTLALMFA